MLLYSGCAITNINKFIYILYNICDSVRKTDICISYLEVETYNNSEFTNSELLSHILKEYMYIF